jgi:hypothetical protein
MTDEISSCQTCGRSTIAKRFCSDRCRSACDAGFPRPDPPYVRKVAASKLAGWKVIATTPDGPPIGSDYYAPFLPAAVVRPNRARRRQKVSNGVFSFKIRPCFQWPARALFGTDHSLRETSIDRLPARSAYVTRDLACLPLLISAPCLHCEQISTRGSDAAVAPVWPQFGQTIRVSMSYTPFKVSGERPPAHPLLADGRPGK